MDGGVIVNDHHAQRAVGCRAEKCSCGEEFAVNVETTVVLDGV